MFIDNRKCNLREASTSENNMNSNKRKTYSKKSCSSIYKGVYYWKKRNKFQAYVDKDHKRTSLGLFTNEIDAAKAYNKKAKELFGEYAKLNITEHS